MLFNGYYLFEEGVDVIPHRYHVSDHCAPGTLIPAVNEAWS